MSYRKAYFLFKQAVDAFEGKEMPEWIKEHPSIKKRKEVEKIFAQYGLANFRKEVDIPQDIRPGPSEVVDLLNAMTEPLENAVDRLNSKIRYNKDEIKYLSPIESDNDIEKARLTNQIELLDQLVEFIKSSIDSINSNDLKCKQQVKLGDKIILNKGQGIFKAHRHIVKLIKDIANIEIDPVDSLNAYKDYVNASLDKGKYAVVFAAEGAGAWDIATMSMRGIKSCQSWDSDMSYKTCIIGSILSKHVGIIYLTNSKDYQGRGEKMNFRSVVRFLIDEKDPDKKYILVDKVYRSESDQILEIFKKALQEKTSIPVIDSNEIRDIAGSGRLAIPEEDVLDEIGENERSYIDYPAREFIKYKNKTPYQNCLEISKNPRSTEEELLGCLERFPGYNEISLNLLDNPATTFKILLKVFRGDADSIINYLLENSYSKLLKDDEVKDLLMSGLKNSSLYDYSEQIQTLLRSPFNSDNKYDQLWISILDRFGDDGEIAKFIKNPRVMQHSFDQALKYTEAVIMTKLKANKNLKDPVLRTKIEEFFKTY